MWLAHSIKQSFQCGEWGVHEGENLPILKGLLCARHGARPPTFISFNPYCNTKRLGRITPFYRLWKLRL